MLVTFVMLQCPGLVSREVVISKRYKFMEERKFTTKQIMFGCCKYLGNCHRKTSDGALYFCSDKVQVMPLSFVDFHSVFK